MNLPGTIEALKNAEKTLENCMSISAFYHHLGDFLFSQLPVFFMKVTMNGKISLVEGMRKHRKTMRNKCPEQTLQVRIQYCIQLRSSLATMMLNVLHTAFSLFPVITIAVTYRCMLQCLGEQCIKWWKATKLKLCGQRKRSLHHRSSPSDSPASDQGKHQGYHGLLNNLSIKKTVRMNIGQRHVWKDVKQAQWNQLWGADDLVKIVFIGEPTINNGEQGESASKVCLFAPSINYKT